MLEIVSTGLADPAGAESTPRCRAAGLLISKNGCYALRDSGGVDIWLEMDRIPLHLIEVEIEGLRYAENFISVKMVVPI